MLIKRVVCEGNKGILMMAVLLFFIELKEKTRCLRNNLFNSIVLLITATEIEISSMNTI